MPPRCCFVLSVHANTGAEEEDDDEESATRTMKKPKTSGKPDIEEGDDGESAGLIKPDPANDEDEWV